jgi:hypothetical protein
MPGFACEQIFREMHPFGDLCVICMGYPWTRGAKNGIYAKASRK